MTEELGSGFFLAMHDLEIRGAGEVLGENQSGEIQEIGFACTRTCSMPPVKALKKGEAVPDLTQPLDVTSEINLHEPALLPNDYCSDVHERLTLYKRLANCEPDDDLQAMQEELIDRFGELPAQAQALLETHRLRIAAQAARHRQARCRRSEDPVQLHPQPAGRADPRVRSDPEESPLQAGRAGQACRHRADRLAGRTCRRGARCLEEARRLKPGFGRSAPAA